MIIESKGRGHNLPTGGELFGYLADAFRLRETDELSQIGKKSQQRFFNGEQEKLDPASAEKVIEDVMGAIALLFGKDHFIEEDGGRILDPRWINIFVQGGLEAYAMWNTITVRVC